MNNNEIILHIPYKIIDNKPVFYKDWQRIILRNERKKKLEKLKNLQNGIK